MDLSEAREGLCLSPAQSCFDLSFITNTGTATSTFSISRLFKALLKKLKFNAYPDIQIFFSVHGIDR
jgi:hypothetical protein